MATAPRPTSSETSADYTKLDVAIVRATNHAERPSKEKHIKESILHVLWESDLWLQTYCVNDADKLDDLDASNGEPPKYVQNNALSANGGVSERGGLSRMKLIQLQGLYYGSINGYRQMNPKLFDGKKMLKEITEWMISIHKLLEASQLPEDLWMTAVRTQLERNTHSRHKQQEWD